MKTNRYDKRGKPKEMASGVVFRDTLGRFVAQAERYQKAVSAQRYYRTTIKRGYELIYETILPNIGKPITPKRLVDLLPQDEFENLNPSYGKAKVFVPHPKVRKYTAWDLAHQAESQPRGMRGRLVKVTMNLKDGRATRKINFYTRIRRKGPFAIGLFLSMNKALLNEGMFLYNRVGSKLLPDRKGKKVHLQSMEIQSEL